MANEIRIVIFRANSTNQRMNLLKQLLFFILILIGSFISQNIVDKILHLFFTTKPTGQGTGLGLGLSLAYDIIKAHGEIKVETKEGEGSEVIIQLDRTHQILNP